MSGILEGWSGLHESPDAIQCHHEEVHDQQGGLGGQAGQQGDGARRVDAPKLEVLKTGLPHFFVSCDSIVAENLQGLGGCETATGEVQRGGTTKAASLYDELQ